MAISCWARRSAIADVARALAKRQSTMDPANASMRESAPKPMSAIDPAASPAPTAIAASTPCQPTPSQASALARRTRWSCWLVVGRVAAGEGTPAARGVRRAPCSGLASGVCGKCVEEQAGPFGELVHDHLAVAPGAGEAGAPELAQVVGDELFVAAEHPAQIADARLVAVAQRDRDREPCGVAERLCDAGEVVETFDPGLAGAQGFGLGQVEAQQVARVGLDRHAGERSRTFAHPYERPCVACVGLPNDMGDARLES